MRSLQARLSTGLLIGLVGLLAMQWAVVSMSIRNVTEDYVASRLEHDVEGLLAGLTFSPAGAPRVDRSRLNAVYLRPFSGHYFRVTTAQGVERSRSLWDQDLAVPMLSPGESARLHLAGPQDQPLLVLVRGFSKARRHVTIAAAEDLSPIAGDVRQFQLRYAVVSLVILVALILVQRFSIRSGLRPLERVRRDVTRLERGEIAQLGEEVPTEVQPLVSEINRLLEVMADRLQRSRNALGNLAHALKTPLTLLTQVVDDPQVQSTPALSERLSQPLVTMRELMERELKRARLAGGGAPGRSFRPDQEVPALVETLARIYSDRALSIEYHIPPSASFAADREDLLELMGNLLDNACKWGRRQVVLTVEDAAGLVFSVEDDGPGCPPEMVAQLTERGVRVDESTAGHGLGLAIVRDIVASYAGALHFGRSQRLGGLRVEVCIPPPPGEQST